MLDKNTLKNRIQQALDDESNAPVDPAEARERTAEKLADAFYDFVVEATIVYNSGLANSAGAVTGIFNGNIQ